MITMMTKYKFWSEKFPWVSLGMLKKMDISWFWYDYERFIYIHVIDCITKKIASLKFCMILCIETISGKIQHFGVVVANSKHLFKLKNDIQFFSP